MDQNKKTLRSFQCRDYLWEVFGQMSGELECSVDYLINEAMRQYARSRNYGASVAAALPTGAAIQNPGYSGAPPSFSSAPPSYGAPRPPSGAGYGGPPPLAPQSAHGSVPPMGAPPPLGGYGSPAGGPPPLTGSLPPPYSPPQQAGYGAPARASYGAPPPLGAPSFSPPAYGHQPPLGPGSLAPPPLPGAHAHSGARPPLSVIFNGQKFSVNKDEFVIGRGAKTADLPVKDGNISRRHAAVVFENGAFFMKDLGSTNGIEFMGRRVDSKRIEEGDLFMICDYEFRFTYR